MGHVRYATRGRKDRLLDDAHPHCIGGKENRYPKHIIIRDAEASIVHNGQVSQKYLSRVDSSLDGCDSEAFLHLYKILGPERLMKEVPGSYSAAIFDRHSKGAFILRDRHGIKPCWLGKKNEKFFIASEDVAIKKIYGDIIKEVRPGKLVFINDRGEYQSSTILEPQLSVCFFEFNYIQNDDSHFNGVNVREARRRLGIQLQKEFCPPDIDIITYVPHCPRHNASGYSEACDKEMKEIFYKRKEERSFLQPVQKQREQSIEENLYLLDNIDIKGKNIVIIDDSIVRGTVVRRAVKLCKEAGAGKVYFLSATPPIGGLVENENRGCLYGVDMPPGDRFAIVEHGNVEGIERYSGADKVYYITKKGMIEAIGIPEDQLCTYCIGGPKPFD
jgi:amidophosphoribosyltransferase